MRWASKALGSIREVTVCGSCSASYLSAARTLDSGLIWMCIDVQKLLGRCMSKISRVQQVNRFTGAAKLQQHTAVLSNACQQA